MKAQRDICRNISLKRNRIGDRPSLSFAGPNPLQIACSKGKPLFLRIKLHRREKTSSLPGQKPQTSFTFTRSLQVEFYPSNDSGMTGEASPVKNMEVVGKKPAKTWNMFPQHRRCFGWKNLETQRGIISGDWKNGTTIGPTALSATYLASSAKKALQTSLMEDFFMFNT